MNKLIQILNQRWSIILAFIPGINLAYLIFRFLICIEQTHRVSIWMVGLVAAPICFLYHIFPDTLNWLVTHLILSAIAALMIEKSRGGYYAHFRFSKDAIFFLTVFGIVGIVLIRCLPLVTNANQVSNKTESALHAIVQNDEHTWQTLFHPEYGTELMDLQEFKRALQSNNILIAEDFRYGVGRTAASKEKVEEGSAIGLDALIVSNGTKYRVSVIYQETESGSGFVDFRIINANN